MALLLKTHITIDGEELTHFSHLVIHQTLFGHHQFSLHVPFDVFESSTSTFLVQAHKKLCGKKITISFSAEDKHLMAYGSAAKQDFEFQFIGIITQLEVGNQGDFSGAFHVQGYSPTYLMDGAPIRRTFRQKDVSFIFKKIAGGYPQNLLKLKAQAQSAAPLPYVAQYNESDFAFLSRLAAQHGEWLYFDGVTLQLGRSGSPPALPFVSDGVRSSFHLTVGLRHSAFVMSQYNAVHHRTFRADSAGKAVNWLGQHPFARFAQSASEHLFTTPMQLPAALAVQSQAALDQEATRMKSQHATSLVKCHGWGENPDMRLGSVIEASGIGLGSAVDVTESYGIYFITAIAHTVNEAGAYSNTFEAVPYSAQHPPLNGQHRPPLGQPEAAEVVDVKDPQHLGRVRVRYYWPVEHPAEAETDWLRVSTPYSGAGKGQLFTPEVGSQVLVGYEHNRAEWPLVLSNLFHAKNKQGAKYTHNGGEVKGIQTIAGNRVTFHDKKGEEKIVITNGNKKETAIEISFKGKGKVEIKTQGDLSFTAGQNVSIEAGQNVAIKASKKLTFDADELASKTSKATAIKARTKVTVAGSSGVDVKGKLNQST